MNESKKCTNKEKSLYGKLENGSNLKIFFKVKGWTASIPETNIMHNLILHF